MISNHQSSSTQKETQSQKVYLLHNLFGEDAEERDCAPLPEGEPQRRQERKAGRSARIPGDNCAPTREGGQGRLEQGKSSSKR